MSKQSLWLREAPGPLAPTWSGNDPELHQGGASPGGHYLGCLVGSTITHLTLLSTPATQVKWFGKKHLFSGV